MKNGFTLVELMVVVVIISLISLIAYAGITGVQGSINANMWQSKVEMIENGAALYGEDNENLLNKTCVVNDVTYNECMTITVKELIDRNYIQTDEIRCIEYEENSDNCLNSEKTVTNDTLNEDDANYYTDNLNVNIYIQSGIVYAKLDY